MLNLINLFWQYHFLQRALFAGLLIGLIAPLIGNFLVLRRYSLIGDTLAHLSLAGVALGLFMGINPLFSSVILTLLAAFLIEQIRLNSRIEAGAILAMFLPAGLSISLILLSLSNGFNTNLFSYLFGSITTVTQTELWLILMLGVLSFGWFFVWRQKLLAVAFDEEGAKVSGVNAKMINLGLVLLNAITISLALRVVGALLISALLVIPVNTARLLAKSFSSTLIYAVCFSELAIIFGLLFSFIFNLPSGAAIVLLSLFFFGVIRFLV